MLGATFLGSQLWVFRLQMLLLLEKKFYFSFHRHCYCMFSSGKNTNIHITIYDWTSYTLNMYTLFCAYIGMEGNLQIVGRWGQFQLPCLNILELYNIIISKLVICYKSGARFTDCLQSWRTLPHHWSIMNATVIEQPTCNGCMFFFPTHRWLFEITTVRMECSGGLLGYFYCFVAFRDTAMRRTLRPPETAQRSDSPVQ